MSNFFLTVAAIIAGLLFGTLLVFIAYYGFELRGFYMLIASASAALFSVLPAILASHE